MQTPIASLTTPSSSSTGQSQGTAARLKQVCQQFEGQFMALMLQEMRKTIPKDPLLGDDGHTEEIFTQMMDEQVAQEMAKHGGANDLAAALYKQLAGRAGLAADPAADQPAGANTASAAAEAASPAAKPATQEEARASR